MSKHDKRVLDLEERLRDRGTYLGLRTFMPYSQGEFDILGVKRTSQHTYFFHYYEVKETLSRSQIKKAKKQAKRFYETMGTKHQFILTDGREFIRIKPHEVLNGRYR